MIAKFIFIISLCSSSQTPFDCQKLYQSCINNLNRENLISYEQKQVMCTNLLGVEVLKWVRNSK